MSVLVNWLSKGWPRRDKRGKAQGIRVFVLYPEDIAYVMVGCFSEEELQRIRTTNVSALIARVRKRLEAGLEDWSQLIEDEIWREFLGATKEE